MNLPTSLSDSTPPCDGRKHWFAKDAAFCGCGLMRSAPLSPSGAVPPTKSATDAEPANGYGIRKCRGHWHVCHYANGEESEDLAIPGDPFNSRDDALDAADKLNRNESLPPLLSRAASEERIAAIETRVKAATPEPMAKIRELILANGIAHDDDCAADRRHFPCICAAGLLREILAIASPIGTEEMTSTADASGANYAVICTCPNNGHNNLCPLSSARDAIEKLPRYTNGSDWSGHFIEIASGPMIERSAVLSALSPTTP